MATASPEESVVALSFGQYLTERRSRVQDILSTRDLALDDVDVVLGAFMVRMHGRTEVLLSDYLADNGMQDYDERTVPVIERVFQHGLRLRAVSATLGHAGISLGTIDSAGEAHIIAVGTHDELQEQEHLKDNSVLGSLVDMSMVSTREKEAGLYEAAELLGKLTGKFNVGQRMVGMLAIHVAEMDQAVSATGHTTTDIMNQGAQLYCMLAELQRTASPKMYLRDRERFAVPLPDDLNGLALSDNPHWLEKCGPAFSLP